MAKQTALELVNRILTRLGKDEVTDISALTAGTQGDIVLQLFNEAQNDIYMEDIEWYSLYATREFDSVTYTASTISFADADPDTIDDSASGFGSFSDGMQVLVSGSGSNDGAYTVNTAAAGTLTLQSADNLTAESAGESVTITAITYPVATDWSRTITLLDKTNDRFLDPDDTITFDEIDPDSSETSTPTHYSLNGDFYRIHPIVAGTYTFRERYYRIPTAFTANTDTSILPIEVENAMIFWVLAQMLEYSKNFDEADRKIAKYNHVIKKAKRYNKQKINKDRRFQAYRRDTSIRGPRLPSSYGPNYGSL